MRGGQTAPSREEAAIVALTALSFLAGDPASLTRFLDLTGFTIAQLKAEAHTSAAQAAILDHLLDDESLLLTFAANAGLTPAAVAQARAALATCEARQVHRMR